MRWLQLRLQWGLWSADAFPHVHGSRGVPSMDPKHTAVVLIEYQNDFTSEGGSLHGAVAASMEQTGMLDHTIKTVQQARALGATIVHAPISFTSDYHELTPEPYG